MASLKQEVAKGFVWHSVEKFGNTAFQTLISLFLARILTPADFGLVGMLVVFSVLAQSIVEGGLSQAIIRKGEPTEQDYTSAFYFNTILSVIIYLGLLAITPLIADFYSQPKLREIAPILFAVIPISALGFIQTTYLIKMLDFKTSSKIVLTASLISGIAAFWVAWRGYGVWAIVAQIVVRDLIRVILLWSWRSWRPTGWIERRSINDLLGFGSKLVASNIIAQLTASISQLFIGRAYNATMLGLFYNSQKLKDNLIGTMLTAVQNVTFPAMVHLQNDSYKLRESSRKVVKVVSFALFPIITGLILTARELFELILTQKWIDAIPYFMVFCISAYVAPASNVFYNIMKIRGLGGRILRLEIIKQAILLSMLIVAISHSVMAVAIVSTISTIISLFIFHYGTRKEIDYSLWRLLKDSLPYIAMCLAMSVAVLAVAYIVRAQSMMMITIAKVSVGVVVYGALTLIFKVEAWRDIKELIRKEPAKRDVSQEFTRNNVTEG